MITIGVIILNYLAYETTIETMNSFFAQKKDGFEVQYVIVDNCSPNESYDKLSKEYRNHPNVIVSRTESNLGFAKGNNYGYAELCKHCIPDFVIVSNNDILLPQQGLFQWIAEAYEKYQFSVLGPDIFSVRGNFHQSPGINRSRDLQALKKELNTLRNLIIKCQIKRLLKLTTYSGVPQWDNERYSEFSDKLTLHGAFQIFSAKYFASYSEPYNPCTFLYLEEDLLKLRCDQKRLRMVYSSDYQIEHLQAVSTNMVNSKAYKKELFRYKCLKDSLKAYIKAVKMSNIK